MIFCRRKKIKIYKCDNCDIEKNKRYLYKNNDDNKNYCITCLKKILFFSRYSYCDNCNSCIYNNFNSYMFLIFDNNNNTRSYCNLCIAEIFYDNSINDLSDNNT